MHSVDYEISDHFYNRAKHRVGLPKRGVSRLVKNALYEGIYVDYLDPTSKYMILFEKPNIAVTILYAPDSIVKCANEYYKRRTDNGCNTAKSLS